MPHVVDRVPEPVLAERPVLDEGSSMPDRRRFRPTVFIGSSSESLEVAYALEQDLGSDTEVTVWSRGVFGPSETTIESLEKSLSQFDVAVFVLGSDDLIYSRGAGEMAPRDNVLFELGLFIGAIGRRRSLILVDESAKPKIPSDLFGVTPLTFRGDRTDRNLRAALSGAAREVVQRARVIGANESAERRHAVVYWAAPHSNTSRNAQVASVLRARGIDVLLPRELVEDNPKYKNGNLPSPSVIRDICREAIDASTHLVVDVAHYGQDSAWEIGYADAVGREVLGVGDGGRGVIHARTFQRREYHHNFMHGWDSLTVHEDLNSVSKAIEGKCVHVCGSFANEQAMDMIRASGLLRSAREVILPVDIVGMRHQWSEIDTRSGGIEPRREAIRLLERCDIALVILPRYGMDTAWQIGHASGLGKQIIGWEAPPFGRAISRGLASDHWMHAWPLRQTFLGATGLAVYLSGLRNATTAAAV
jgi:predicted nucleotide-binding protein/nucleoside 2-deoxyribosyltransferase